MAGSRRTVKPSSSFDDHQQSSMPSSAGEENSGNEMSLVRSNHLHHMASLRQEPAHVSPLYGASWMQQQGQPPESIELMDSARGAQYTYLTSDRALPPLQMAQSYLAQQHQQAGPLLDPNRTWERPEAHRLGYSYPSGNESTAGEPMRWANQATQEHGPIEWTEQSAARQRATLGLHSESQPAPGYLRSSIVGDPQRFRQSGPHHTLTNNHLPNRIFSEHHESQRPNDPGPHAHTVAARTSAWSMPQGSSLAAGRYGVPSNQPLGVIPGHNPDRQLSQSAPIERTFGFNQFSLPSVGPRANAEKPTLLPSWRPHGLAERSLTRMYVSQDISQWPTYVQTSIDNEAPYEGVDPEEEKFPCDKCGKRFRQKPDLSRHKVSVHKAEGQLYKCVHVPMADSKCQGIFKRRDNLRDHLKRKHRVEDKDEMKRLLEDGKIQGGTPESRLSEGPSERGQSSATGCRST